MTTHGSAGPCSSAATASVTYASNEYSPGARSNRRGRGSRAEDVEPLGEFGHEQSTPSAHGDAVEQEDRWCRRIAVLGDVEVMFPLRRAQHVTVRCRPPAYDPRLRPASMLRQRRRSESARRDLRPRTTPATAPRRADREAARAPAGRRARRDDRAATARLVGGRRAQPLGDVADPARGVVGAGRRARRDVGVDAPSVPSGQRGLGRRGATGQDEPDGVEDGQGREGLEVAQGRRREEAEGEGLEGGDDTGRSRRPERGGVGLRHRPHRVRPVDGGRHGPRTAVVRRRTHPPGAAPPRHRRVPLREEQGRCRAGSAGDVRQRAPVRQLQPARQHGGAAQPHGCPAHRHLLVRDEHQQVRCAWRAQRPEAQGARARHSGSTRSRSRTRTSSSRWRRWPA